MSKEAEAWHAMIREVVQEELKTSIRTTVPGYISSFDPVTQFAKVQIGVKAVDIYGKSYALPPIIDCPMVIYGGSGGSVDVKILEGDEVLIQFSHRCIEGWRESGGIAENPNPRRFSYSDAFAELSPKSRNNALVSYTTDGIRMRSKDATKFVWIKDSGEILLQNNGGYIKLTQGGTVYINGAQILTDGTIISPTAVQTPSAIVNGKELADHIHPAGSPPGNTGPNS